MPPGVFYEKAQAFFTGPQILQHGSVFRIAAAAPAAPT